MVFSSLSFLFFFFPIVLLGYVLIKPRYADLWLLAASLVFYYIGAGRYVFLLLFIIAAAYVSGLLLQRCGEGSVRRVLLFVSVAVMLLVMTYYKYWDFAITNIDRFFSVGLPLKHLVLPIGISFFIFQAISYVVDVYRGEEALTDPVKIGLYISFFPQLIAGPIVRFSHIRPYLDEEHRQLRAEDVQEGIWRFCVGLCKKVILANNLGGLADIVFGAWDISQFSVLYTWLVALAYTLQIYYDFSGYSDMAIGLGRVFGFSFRENFNYPYVSRSIKEFWRRWHISLSQFFRDYVYIPLGGSRCSKARWMFNILFVWLLTGLWHGAAWTYILWGAVYGVLLLAERLLGRLVRINTDSRPVRALQHVYTMTAVVLLWVVFRADGVGQALAYLKNMFGIGASAFIDRGFLFQLRNYAVLLVAAVIFAVPASGAVRERLTRHGWLRWAQALLLMGCVAVSVSYVYMGSYNPFLYFMF